MAERENRREGRGGNDRRDNRPEENPEFADRLVAINRVSKTVKGGRIFQFTALTVVGDGNGKVGFGRGKAREVPIAIQKAMEAAPKLLKKFIELHPSVLQNTAVVDIIARYKKGKKFN